MLEKGNLLINILYYRIHIYDVNLAANYGEGNEKGKLTFKIRKKDDNVKGYNKEFENLKEHFQSSGLAITKTPKTPKNKQR